MQWRFVMKKVFAALLGALMIFSACSNGADSSSSPYQPPPAPTPEIHTITVATVAHGKISADKSSAKSEETVTLTITPDPGCELIALDVGGGYGISGSGNTRTFTMPNADVTVKGVFCVIVSLGEYPQTIKASNVTVDEGQSKTAGGFTYYKGSDDAWYVKQYENAKSSGEKYSDGTAVGQGGTSYKYFKVEPIKWRVVSTNYGGKKLLMANQVLSMCEYYDTKEEDRVNIHPNNYKESKVRAFLNGLEYNKSGTTDSSFLAKGFLQTAFSSSDLASILDTTVDNSADSTACPGVSPATGSACENTTDKIFLLSLKEATDSSYGFPTHDAGSMGNTRIIKSSDYAKACGVDYPLLDPDRYGSIWQLRSPVENTSLQVPRYYGVRMCGDTGKIVGATLESLGAKSAGVVPALCVNN